MSDICGGRRSVGSCGTCGEFISVDVSSLVKLLVSEGNSILDVSCDKALSVLLLLLFGGY